MQAILILAHRNFDQIFQLCKTLKPDFEIYIHFDVKIPLNQAQKDLMEQDAIHYISEIDVHWGAWSVTEAELRLMEEALKNPKIDFVHLISGQDWPLQNPKKIREFYEKNDKIYLMAKPAKEETKSGERLIWWQQFYFNYDKINRRSTWGKIYHRVSLNLQRLLRINKLKKLGIDLEIYSGPQWCNLPRDVAQYCLDFMSQYPNYSKMLQTSFCSDEFWLPTIVYNEPKFSERIVGKYYRYIKWEEQHGSYPAILDERDYEAIRSSGAFFGRKFDTAYSQDLINRLESQNKSSVAHVERKKYEN
ncbi:beta-1,6-N-acetylglucosaminyltransferase [Streptococcus sobrinus]|uniref:beta-1,6-N-acetylglucosaminyltransferase n=1 Tax=Streptococcus sobrinus TaxID=1310 RepID=UPI0002E9C6E8|nr:beta-1,6-N-acetylglucosaminyltransferase [Streptococcus sobrinus]